MMLFQFQNGAIKSSLIFIEDVECFQLKFQFQNGAIKSHPSLPTYLSDCSFQFQNGAIKSGFIILAPDAVELIICFNSKMVRLKVFSLNQVKTRLPSFQFQNGAIKSRVFGFYNW